jgi:hypothetical protein
MGKSPHPIKQPIQIKNLLSPRNLPEQTKNERNLPSAWITTSDGQEPPSHKAADTNKEFAIP